MGAGRRPRHGGWRARRGSARAGGGGAQRADGAAPEVAARRSARHSSEALHINGVAVTFNSGSVRSPSGVSPWLAGFVVLVALAIGAPASAAVPQVAAYYDGGMPVADIPAADLNAIIYSLGEPTRGNVCDSPGAAQLKDLRALRGLRRRHPGLQLLVSIGGWDTAPQYSDIALTAASRAKFARSCIRLFIQQQRVNGIDLDWEFPVRGGLIPSRPQDRADATALVRELREQLDALGRRTHRHYLLTVATPAGTWQEGGAYSVSDSYDLAALVPYVSWLNVMTYDMNTIFSPYSGFNTPMKPDPRDPTPEAQRSWDNLSGAVRYYEAHGVPADKIMLGMAFYGRGFTGVSARYEGRYSRFTGIMAETPWKTIESRMLTDPHWARYWSATAEAPWLYDARRHAFFTYDDPQSLALKGAFVRRAHLRGAMIWVLGEDDAGNSLLHGLLSGLRPRASR